MVRAGRYHDPAVTSAPSGARAASQPTAARSASEGGASASAKPKRSSKVTRPVVPDVPGIARVIAIANQKGGVGKSTTAVSLGAALADLGYRVLVVDLDPQGNASTGMGIKHEAREITVYDVVVAEAPVADAIVHTQVERLHAIPSTIDLAGAEIELVSQFSREGRLKKALADVREGVYDFILMDCPPSLGLLTVNALTAAEELIVPIQCEYYALEGLGQLLRNVSLVQQNINPNLRLSGIVMTMFDPRTKLSGQVVQEVRNYFGELVYDIIIPRTVRLSEAPGYGQPITVYDPKSRGAECYRELAREVAVRPPPAEPMPVYEDLPTVVVPAVEDSVTQAPMDEAELTEVPTVHAVVDEAQEEAAPAGSETAEDELEAEAVQQDVTMAVETAVEDVISEDVTPGPSPVSARQVDPETLEDDLWDDVEESEPEPPRVQPPSTPAPPGHLPERRVVVIDENAEYAVSSAPAPSEPAGSDESTHQAVADIGATLEDDDGQPKRRWRLFRKGGE
jgi:chromosome partitioning protein